MVRLPAPLRPLFPYLKPAFVQATRMAAPTSRLVSRARGGLLPQGVVPTLAEAAVSTGGRYEQARAAERVPRPAPEGLPAGMPLTDTSEGREFPAIGVAELPGGRVLGPHHAVVSGRGDLVHEVSWYFGTRRPREHPLFLTPFPPPPRHVDGRLGVLAVRGDANYYHYLLDVVVRLGVLEQAPSVPAPDRWYASVGGPSFQRQLLELVGIPTGAVVDAVEHPHVSADLLVVPSVPAMREVDPPWAVDWLRDRILPRVDRTGPRQRIYVTRSHAAHSRVVVNDEEVSALLDARGFVAIDPGGMTVAEQVRTFANAEIVVGAHGAALANLVFCPPGAGVVELFPRGCLLADFSRLVSGIGLRHRYLSSPGRTPRRGRAAALVRDIEVDLTGLGRLLDELS